jgi:hypothetical protein
MLVHLARAGSVVVMAQKLRAADPAAVALLAQLAWLRYLEFAVILAAAASFANWYAGIYRNLRAFVTGVPRLSPAASR